MNRVDTSPHNKYSTSQWITQLSLLALIRWDEERLGPVVGFAGDRKRRRIIADSDECSLRPGTSKEETKQWTTHM